MKNTDSKIVDIAHFNTCREVLFDVDLMILIRYSKDIAKARA